MLKELITRNRTQRRFDPSVKVGYDTFCELVELARLSAVAANRQSLRYAFAADGNADTVFDSIKWAGFYTDGAPTPDKRPPAYILVLNDDTAGQADPTSVGIAIQSMLLGAAQAGLACCVFGSIHRPRLHKALGLGAQISIVNVIAIGKGAEQVAIDDITADQSTKYYRSQDGVHHVPKIIAKDLVVKI